MRARLIVLLAIAMTIAAACSSTKSVPTVRRLDSNHGLGYPYTFERARELRAAEKFLPAAYIYVHLFPEFPDSVVHEVWRMNGEAYYVDSTRLAPYYVRQSVATEVLADGDITPQGPIPAGGTKINREVLDKLTHQASDLLDALSAYGIH